MAPDHLTQAATLSAAETKQRFDWARRRGQPQWLWPDLAIADWREALDEIEAVLRAVMAGGSAHLAGDPDVLCVACYTSGVGPLLGYWSETGRITAAPPVQVMLALHLRHNRARMARLTGRARDAAGALAAEGIRATVLKGMHTAHLYFPEPGARPLSDIDLLIRPEDEPNVSKVLAGLGYQLERHLPGPPPQRIWRMPGTSLLPRSLGLLHEDDPWTIDLQPSLDRAYRADPVHLDPAARRAAVDPWPISVDADVLTHPLLLLHLAVHAGGGLINTTLIRLVELVMVIRRDFHEGPASWIDFTGLAAETGASGLAYPALSLCEKLVPGTVPAEILESCRRQVPDAVKRVLAPLTPAHAHRVLRYSLSERFMWTLGWGDVLRLIIRETILPATRSMPAVIGMYRTAFWRLVRGTMTR